jgi:hypothetical protein
VFPLEIQATGNTFFKVFLALHQAPACLAAVIPKKHGKKEVGNFRLAKKYI